MKASAKRTARTIDKEDQERPSKALILRLISKALGKPEAEISETTEVPPVLQRLIFRTLGDRFKGIARIYAVHEMTVIDLINAVKVCNSTR